MTNTELAQRLEKLERDNRRLKRLGIAAMVIVAALGAMSATQSVPQTVEAHKLILLDRQGRSRITISTPAALHEAVAGMQPDDPGIWISDSKGQDRFILTDNMLSFLNESGRETVRLMTLANRAALDFIGDENQKIGKFSFPVDRMELATEGLYFDDRNGTPAITLGGLGPKARLDVVTRSLSLFDAQGNERATMRLDSSGVPLVAVRNAQGDGGVGMELNSLGAPGISLTDPQGYSMDLGSTAEVNSKTGATQQTSADSIIMFGNGKKHPVIWQAP